MAKSRGQLPTVFLFLQTCVLLQFALTFPLFSNTRRPSHHQIPASASSFLTKCSQTARNEEDDHDIMNTNTRRDLLRASSAALLGGLTSTIMSDSRTASAIQAPLLPISKEAYVQRFPTLFAPLYGSATRKTVKRQLSKNFWVLEQNIELGPLQVPVRCVVILLLDGTLWVHAPLAPTQEFLEMVESCAADGDPGSVAHVVVPTYALEHKVFAKDALLRWPNAKLWTAPGQFNFPVRNVSEEYVWGKSVNGVLSGSDLDLSNIDQHSVPSWTDEIQYETLSVGTFNIAGKQQTFYETAFFHVSSKTLIVTDSLAQINTSPPILNSPESLLLISKRSTADPLPEDTVLARQIGWEKNALLVSYFFPEHEELDPDAGFGVVTWTDGWHDNFKVLAGRLIVPPVVRTLLYRQNPVEVRRWVQQVVARWDLKYIVPAHFEAPIRSSPVAFEAAFRFLEDDTIDFFPANDLARGLKPIADIIYKK